MPFKSKAQRRKFAQLLVEGKISDETYEEWNRETGRKELPERVKAKSKSSKSRPAKKSRLSKTKSPRKRAPKKSRRTE
jgi:MoxR-like ATPase